MNLAYRIYHLLSQGLFLGIHPFLWSYSRFAARYSESIKQRMGEYPPDLLQHISGAPRIWIHAVSVGEVQAALAIIDTLITLLPESAIILSTTTFQGQGFALHQAQNHPNGSRITCIFAPLDFGSCTQKALTIIRPDILVFIETEIWPNWLTQARQRGIRTVFANGRISDRSIKSYLSVRPLFRDVLKGVDAFSMINDKDAQRIRDLGALPQKIEVNGNAKFDLSNHQADALLKTEMETRYNLSGMPPVIVAGSVRGAEPELILDVYEQVIQSIPETILIMAPRHLSRVGQLETLLKARGLVYDLRTGLSDNGKRRRASIVIIDTIGELRNIYSMASIVFCGGSLVPLGGQNIIEPAAWGKPVLYGPSMENFLDAKRLLERSGGGIPVKNSRELTEKAIYLLSHPQEALRIGRLAHESVMSNRGAAKKHAAIIARFAS
ncbi:MAG: glycosyltransferase N-terminal domain-containing protein [Desulfobacterales bacterium]